MRDALSDARRTVSAYESGQDGTSDEAIADVGRTVGKGDVTAALRASERAQDEAGEDGQDPSPGANPLRKARTATVDDIRRELSRPCDEDD